MSRKHMLCYAYLVVAILSIAPSTQIVAKESFKTRAYKGTASLMRHAKKRALREAHIMRTGFRSLFKRLTGAPLTRVEITDFAAFQTRAFGSGIVAALFGTPTIVLQRMKRRRTDDGKTESSKNGTAGTAPLDNAADTLAGAVSDDSDDDDASAPPEEDDVDTAAATSERDDGADPQSSEQSGSEEESGESESEYEGPLTPAECESAAHKAATVSESEASLESSEDEGNTPTLASGIEGLRKNGAAFSDTAATLRVILADVPQDTSRDYDSAPE